METLLKPPYKLFDYQKEAIKWMRQRELASEYNSNYGICGGILCLKMGMGKTLVSLAHILTSETKGKFPTLIIVSKTIMNEWKTEGIEKFFFEKQFKVLYLHKDFLGKEPVSQINREKILGYDIVITTYDVCQTVGTRRKFYEECIQRNDNGKILCINSRSEQQSDLPNETGTAIIYSTPWHRVIADEGHRFSNPKTIIFKCVMAVYGKYKWILSGTPIRNYSTDIWCLFRFLGYNGMKTPKEWKMYNIRTYKQHGLDKIILRKDYKSANIQLPNKIEHVHYVFPSENELKVYEYVLKKTREIYDDMLSNLCDYACVLAMFTRLRQSSIAAYLLTNQSKRSEQKTTDFLSSTQGKGDFTLGGWCHDKTTEAGIDSLKMTEAINILKTIPKNEKVLVFSSFTSCLDLLSQVIQIKLPDYKFSQLDGDVTGNDRQIILKNFRDDPEIKCLLLTYKTGSEGINLTQANHCIYIDPWWNNATHEQASARAWRTGQSKPVHIYQLIAINTIEERILELCSCKDEMADNYLACNLKALERKSESKSILGLEIMRQMLDL